MAQVGWRPPSVNRSFQVSVFGDPENSSRYSLSMADFSYSSEITINATPEKIFEIVSDPAKHAALAGSNELKKITQQPSGPVGPGTHILAEETVMMADGTGMDLTADSIVVTFDTPKSFSWIVNQPSPNRSGGCSGGST